MEEGRQLTDSRLKRKELGALGEAAAEQRLNQQGFRLLARNWRCRTGEIDIIAMDGEILVFVEVRTRSGRGVFGTPQESVNVRKQRQIVETSQVYLHQERQYDRQIRYDVIAVQTDPTGAVLHIEEIRNAF
ncbi:putative endonuclease [Paenibacillus sp. PvR052]|nr:MULTISPECIES: YraN family protein [unclassified Paenibacillus]